MADLQSLERTVGEFPIVYEVVYAWTHHIRRSTCGGMDSEPTGQTERVQTVQHVVTHSQASADLIAKQRYGFGDQTIVSVVPICTIDLVLMPTKVT